MAEYVHVVIPDSDKTPLRKTRMDSAIGASRVKELEDWIDRADSQLEELSTFVLPTGCEAAARMHVARTMIRRAERRVVALRDSGERVRPEAIIYLNRLSDVLFVCSRLINQENGISDIPWLARKERRE